MLLACTGSPVLRTVPQCAVGTSSDRTFSPFSSDELKLMLPSGSSLARSNTEDARYWVWSTPMGEVSVAWVSEIARQTRLKATSPEACRISSDRVGFIVDWNEGQMTAISDALIDNGAGLLVRHSPVSGGSDRASALEVLRGIEIVVKRE
jgi:hypothetical protein